MSFISPIAGYIPNNQFVYTSTNLSVDNVSCNNLSAVNASLINLTTTTFSPVNVNSSNLTTTDLDVTNLAIINNLHTSYIHVSNMSLDGTIGGNTANFINVNSDNNITDELYLNEQSAVLTDKSLIKRDANQVNFIGKSNASDTNGADFLFRTGTESDAVKLTISRTSDIVTAIAIGVDTTIEADTGIFNTINVSNPVNLSTINASNISVDNVSAGNISCVNLSASNDISGLEVRGSVIVSSPIFAGNFIDTNTGDITNLSTDNISSYLQTVNTVNASTLNSTSIFAQGAIVAATIDADILEALYEFHITDKTTGTSNQTIMHRFSNYFDMYNTNVVAPYKIYTGINTGTPDLEITSSGIIADISPNLAAGTGITLNTVGNITTITNTGIVTDPLNVCQLNASNISCVNLSASKDLSALEIRGSAIVSSPILEGNFVDTNTGDITNLSTVNISSNIITCNVLTANIGGNLAAGTGIALSTLAGVTTISNTGSVSDPLNLSKLNASNISCVNLSASNDISGLEVRGSVIVSSPILEGNFVDTNTGDITNLSTVNISLTNATLATSLTGAGNINITGDIQTTGIINGTTITGDIGGNLAAGTGIALSTLGGVTTISNTGSVSDPLNISKLNASNISCDNISAELITGNILDGDISGNLTAGTNITLSTTGGNTTINSITADPLTINTLNSTTINNTGDINNTTGNINLDVNTGKVYANEFNGSIGRIRSIVSAQNGSYYLTNSTGTGSFAIFSSAAGDFYMNTSPSNFNFGSTSAGTGPVAMTIDGSTKDIEIFTDLTTVDITSSGTITATALTADISSNLTGGYGITLYTVGGNTTISATTGLYMCVTRTGNYAPGGGSTGYVLLYNNISATNGIAYNATNGQATIPFTGLYSISASVNIDNISVNARINIRCRIRINGNWFQGYPQAYGYIRNQNEVTYATATCSDWIVQLTQDDVIDVIAHVGVGSNTSFSSSFFGLQFFNGATFTIRRVDV